MGKMDGKVVIITGGGKGGGIGYGISTAFAKEGANLVITGLHLWQDGEREGRAGAPVRCEVLWVQADGGVEEQVQHVIDRTVKTFGRIDAVVNNARTPLPA